MVGPLEWDALPPGSLVSRRFPLAQAGKVRPIDDLSQSQVNATVSTYEQATVDGPDVICALAVYMMHCLQANGRPTGLRGRSLDLASAYRQLAIADDSLAHAYLSVFDPGQRRSCSLQASCSPIWVSHSCHMHLFAAPDFCSGWLRIVLSFLFLVTLMILWLLQRLYYVEILRRCCA